MAAVIFVGGIASDLIASDLQPILQPYRRWVWLTIAVALVVVVITAITEARRRAHSSGADAPGNTDRSATVAGDVNSSTIVTGDKNFVGNEVGGDSVGRDKIINIHPTSSSAAGPLTHAHEVPPPPADFTGREVELKALLASIQVSGITISGLQGMGGIGKTALALKLGELLKPRYPDAQFFLDLKGASIQTAHRS